MDRTLIEELSGRLRGQNVERGTSRGCVEVTLRAKLAGRLNGQDVRKGTFRYSSVAHSRRFGY